MKKNLINLIIIIIVVISFYGLNNTNKKFKINVEEDSYYIKFIYNDKVEAINIVSDKINNLYLLKYNDKNFNYINKYDVDGIKKVYTINTFRVNINNIKSSTMLFKNNLIKIKVDNKNLCIYKYSKEKTSFKKCNFIYLFDNKFTLPKNYEDINLIVQKDHNKIENNEQEKIYDGWIDIETIDEDELLMIKIKNNKYDIYEVEI